MATSGSQNFSQTRNQLILTALQIIDVYGIGKTVSAEDMDFSSTLLNMMIKAWAGKGLHLWEKTEGVLYLTPYTTSYSLGNASTDAYVTNESDQIITQLNGAHIAADTTLLVDSTTGMASSDNIGIVLSDKTIFWTTISSVDSSTTLTLASGLSGAASDNALIYTFTNRLYKPLRILDARYRTGYGESTSSNSIVDVPITMMSYESYQQLPVKGAGGTPTQATYLPHNTNGTLYLFSAPTDGSGRIHFTYERMIEDLDSASDDFDFPAEWQEPIAWQLALRLRKPFGGVMGQDDILLASTMLEDLLNWDREVTEVNMTPQQDYD